MIRKLAYLCLALLVSAGCNRSKTYSTPDGKVTVEDHGKSGDSTVTITGKNGEQVTINSEGGKLPGDYPKDVPVASGAKVVMATNVNNEKDRGSNLVLESTDSLEHLVAFYQKGLNDNGWKVNATLSQPQMTVITAAKDTRELSLSIQQAEGKCTVTQAVALKN